MLCWCLITITNVDCSHFTNPLVIETEANKFGFNDITKELQNIETKNLSSIEAKIDAMHIDVSPNDKKLLKTHEDLFMYETQLSSSKYSSKAAKKINMQKETFLDEKNCCNIGISSLIDNNHKDRSNSRALARKLQVSCLYKSLAKKICPKNFTEVFLEDIKKQIDNKSEKQDDNIDTSCQKKPNKVKQKIIRRAKKDGRANSRKICLVQSFLKNHKARSQIIDMFFQTEI